MEIDKKISPAPKPNPPATFTIDQEPKQSKPSWFERHKAISVVIILVCLSGSIFVMTKNWDTQLQPVPFTSYIPTKPQTSNLLSDWKTYTNNQYGFSFKYPGDWIDQNRDIKIQDYLSSNSGKIDVLDFELVQDQVKSVVQLAQEDLNKNSCPGDHMIKQDNKGALYQLNCSASSESYVYMTQLSDKNKLKMWYHDNFNENADENTKLTIFNQILSTFKFTK